jgi:hypothetical protein
VTDIRWEGYSHEEIYTAVHTGPGRAASAAAESAWGEVSALIQRIDERITAAMKGSVGGWEGGAADAARSAMSPLAQWALDAANDAAITAAAITTQAEQAQGLRNAMPEPNGSATAWAAFRTMTNESMASFDDLQAAETEEANRAARAVDLMNTYTNNSAENRRNMDYWTLPPQVTVETTGPPPAVAGGPRVGGGFGLDSADAVDIAPAGAPVVPASPGAPGPAGPVAGAPAPAASAGVPTGPAAGAPIPVVPPVGLPSGGSEGNPRAGGGNPGGVPPPATVPGAVRGGRPANPRSAPPGGGRPIVPAPPPRTTPPPTWRDIVPSTREPLPRPPGGTVGPTGRPGPPPLVSRPPEPHGPVGARPGVPGVEPEPQLRSGGPRAGAAPAAAGLYPPMTAGTGAAAQEQEHRRPDYLIDDGEAFADDRWFPSSVITPEDVPPRRRRTDV